MQDRLARQQELTRLGDEITELGAHLDAGEYRFRGLVEAFDREEVWSGTGINSCAHWLNYRCGICIGGAREMVRVARALPALPQISKAFSEGRVSYSKVRAMSRVAPPKNEDALMTTALHGIACLAAPETGNSVGDRYTVDLHTDVETLQADGAETRMDNLVLLCRRHHRLVREGGFGIEARPAGDLVFSLPDGKAIPDTADGRSRGNVRGIRDANRRNGLEITPNTAVPRCCGEKMDGSLAVLALLQRE